jgi:hypothetical protein
LRERSINTLINNLASLRSKVSEEMADMDREVIIPPYQKFWSRIEAFPEILSKMYSP